MPWGSFLKFDIVVSLERITFNVFCKFIRLFLLTISYYFEYLTLYFQLLIRISYEYMKRLEEQLEGEIDKLLELANAQDEKEKDRQLAIAEELKRRKKGLEKIKLA